MLCVWGSNPHRQIIFLLCFCHPLLKHSPFFLAPRPYLHKDSLVTIVQPEIKNTKTSNKSPMTVEENCTLSSCLPLPMALFPSQPGPVEHKRKRVKCDNLQSTIQCHLSKDYIHNMSLFSHLIPKWRNHLMNDPLRINNSYFLMSRLLLCNKNKVIKQKTIRKMHSLIDNWRKTICWL